MQLLTMNAKDTKIKVVITVICLIVPNSCYKNTACDDTSFEKVLNRRPQFIDKTLFLKTLLAKERPANILIRAPRGYGKSTNMDMVNRFLEINTRHYDGHHSRANVKTSPNYKLFSNQIYRLKISKYQKLFDEHFGKYPVISIDYKALSSGEATSNYDSLLAKFKLVLRKSFMQHMYLLNSSKLWPTQDKLVMQERFKKYITIGRQLHELTETDIRNGFLLLPELLHREFRKPVFVLIDEFDTYTDSLDFVANRDADRIVAFVQSITGELLKSNSVGRALLTSVHRQVNSKNSSPSDVNNIVTEYRFLDDHPFNVFHGIIEREFDIVLRKSVGDVEEIKMTKELIQENVNCHCVGKRNLKLYSMFPILNFLRHRNEIGFRLFRFDVD